MTHPSFEAQLDAYLDGELATGDARELEAHLAQCPECTRFRDGRLELRAAISARVPAFQASDTLRKRVRAALGVAARARAPRRFTMRGAWRPLAIAASLAVVAVGSWRLALDRAAGETLADDVLASHIRSLMPGHLTDVPSTDQHTVKPWFNGRLDYVDGRAVAALVYGRRQHLINQFLWPAAHGPAAVPSTSTRQGYHLLHWTTADYSYWVVSDLGLPELRDFAGLLQQADSAAEAPK